MCIRFRNGLMGDLGKNIYGKMSYQDFSELKSERQGVGIIVGSD